MKKLSIVLFLLIIILNVQLTIGYSLKKQDSAKSYNNNDEELKIIFQQEKYELAKRINAIREFDLDMTLKANANYTVAISILFTVLVFSVSFIGILLITNKSLKDIKLAGRELSCSIECLLIKEELYN